MATLLTLVLSCAPICLVASLTQQAESTVEVRDLQPAKEVWANEHRLLEWRYGYDAERHEETYKPVLHLFSPDGAVRLTKGTGGLYPHHRGLYAGWSKVSAGTRQLNTWWSPDGRRDRQELEGFLETPEGIGAALHWITDDGHVAAREERRLRIVEHSQERYILDCELTLHATDADLLLDGDPAHGGFQVRFRQSVAAGESCAYKRSESAGELGNDNWKSCDWVAGTAPVENRRFAIAIIDHPSNPGETVYNTRAYGRFGPFLRTSVTVGQPLVLRYRVAVVDVDVHGHEPAPAYWDELARAFREADSARSGDGDSNENDLRRGD